MLSIHIYSAGALIVYAVLLNEKLSASTPRRKKQIKRDNKMEQQEIIKMKNGSLGSQEKVNYDKYLPFLSWLPRTLVLKKMQPYSCLVTMTNQGWVFCNMTHLFSQSLCRDSRDKGWAWRRKSLERKWEQIISMQRLIDSFYSSPPSSSSSSTPSTGDTSCSGTSYSARNRAVSEGRKKSEKF